MSSGWAPAGPRLVSDGLTAVWGSYPTTSGLEPRWCMYWGLGGMFQRCLLHVTGIPPAQGQCHTIQGSRQVAGVGILVMLDPSVDVPAVILGFLFISSILGAWLPDIPGPAEVSWGLPPPGLYPSLPGLESGW